MDLPRTGQRLDVKLQLPRLQKAVLKSTVWIWACFFCCCFLDAAAWTRWSEPQFWKEKDNTSTSGKRNLFLIPWSFGLFSLLKVVVKRDSKIAPWLLLVCNPLSVHAPCSLQKTIIPKADILLLLRGLCFQSRHVVVAVRFMFLYHFQCLHSECM